MGFCFLHFDELFHLQSAEAQLYGVIAAYPNCLTPASSKHRLGVTAVMPTGIQVTGEHPNYQQSCSSQPSQQRSIHIKHTTYNRLFFCELSLLFLRNFYNA